MSADRVITTARLVLAPISLRVAHAVLAGDLSALRPGPGWPHEFTLDGLVGDVARADGTGTGWFVCLHDGTVIGDCGWKGGPGPDGTAEIGYGLAAPFRRRGYGAEAVRALSDWALAQPGCRRLVARVRPDNHPSRRILDRLGFTLDQVDDDGWLSYTHPHPPILT